MGLYDELTAGTPCDGLVVDTLQRLVGQVARSSCFPPPEGYDRWDDNAALDVVTQLYEDGPSFVTMCWARAGNDGSLERLFLATIRNFLIDQAKGTGTGKLRRRLQRLVMKDVAFTAGKLATGEDAWWLTDSPAAPWFGDVADLERAAGRVLGVRVTALNPSGPTPVRTVTALMKVVSAVLEEAGGAVRAQDVTRIVEHRLGLSTLPIMRPLLLNDPVEQTAASGGAGADAESDVEAAAEAIWETLEDIERSACCNVLKSDRDLEAFLGKGPDETAAIKQWLHAKMRLGCEDTVDVDAVVFRVVQMCAEWP